MLLLHGSVEPVRIDLRRLAARQVEDPDRPRVVRVADLLAVGRPARIVVEARAFEGDLPGLSVAVLGPDAQRVLSTRVREVRDLLAVGGPGGGAVVGGGGAGQGPIVPFLTGDRHDLAAEVGGGARSGGRGALLAA